jgi:signal peptidase I
MAKRSPARPRSEPWDTILFFVKLLLIVIVFRTFLFSSFFIPSQSMLPRLLIGDYLFISKWNYGYSRWSLPFGWKLIPGHWFARDPARGDVVVFRSPDGPGGESHDVIKRVIGLPGDSVQMRAGQLILNGRAVPKQRIADFVLPLTPNFDARLCAPAFQSVADGAAVCRYPRFRETLPNGVSYDVLDLGRFADRDDTGVYPVPAGHVFLMGDNRDDSGDSRFAPPDGMGLVPVDRLEGRAVVTFWSTDGSAAWAKPWTWVTAARWSRIGGGF